MDFRADVLIDRLQGAWTLRSGPMRTVGRPGEVDLYILFCVI